ncbi:unnamed protein product, partial [Musa textilis]
WESCTSFSGCDQIYLVDSFSQVMLHLILRSKSDFSAIVFLVASFLLFKFFFFSEMILFTM